MQSLNKETTMTDNQKLANYIMGYVPKGHVCVIEYRGYGIVLCDGEPLASFRITPDILAGKY